MIDAVRRYDGYIVQSTGDGIFALFGAPVAHEDHPQRALYSALRMQEELKRYSARLREAGNLPIEARVGVNTGEVVVRLITTSEGHAEYTPIGHTANLASRLQALAPTGSIAISEQTRRLVEGYLQLKPLGPTKVKGVNAPVNVYEVTGLGALRTRLQRAAGRGLTKFVGRERELETIKHAAEQTKAAHGQIVGTIAEAGVGKSRLLYEFLAVARSGWLVLEASSVSHGKASAYLPLIDLLNGYFKIRSDDDSRARRERVGGKILMLDRTLEDSIPYLFALLGIVDEIDPLSPMDTQIRKRRTLEGIKRILLRESLNQPLMVIFEDLHWIDEETQAFLNLIADSIANAKILVLINYRPEYSHPWGSKTYYTQLRLDQLGADSAEAMLSALLGEAADLVPLKRLLIEKTEGNPLFLEETVQSLVEDGTLHSNGSLKLARPFEELRIPATVHGIIASRIDRLPGEEKDLLQLASVIGKNFPLSLLRAISKSNENDLARRLDDLQVAEFIYEQPSIGDVEYTFKHASTHEVAYNSMLLERRRLLHLRVADALSCDRPDERLAEIAHHFSRARAYKKAIEYFHRAGKRAFRMSMHAEAVGHLSSAVGMLGALSEDEERDRLELELQITLGSVLVATSGWAAPVVESTWSHALELSKRLSEPTKLFSALRGLWECYEGRGELEKASARSDELFSLAEAAGDTGLRLVAHDVATDTSYWVGDLSRTVALAHVGFELYRPNQHKFLAFSYGGYDPAVACLSFGSSALWMLGYPDQCLAKHGAALSLARELSQPFSEVFALYFAATVSYLRRDALKTYEFAGAAVRLCNEGGFPFWLGLCKSLSGWAHVVLEGSPTGIEQIRRGLSEYMALGARLERPLCLMLLADAHLRSDQIEEGIEAVTEAVAAATEMGHGTFQSELFRLRGELLSKASPSEEAGSQNDFRQSVEIARRQKAKSWELRATTSLARLLAKLGKRDDARAMLADIYNWFTEGFDTADLKEAKALLKELSG
jgi:predicted ATPase